MSKPTELIKIVTGLTREDFPDETWLGWFNEALNDLAKVLKLETVDTFSLNDEASHIIPSDIIEISKLVITDSQGNKKNMIVADLSDGNEEELTENQYWIWDGQIYFKNKKSGEAKLYYYRRPKKAKLSDASFDLLEAYEDALVLFAAAKSKSIDKGWLDQKNAFLDDYYRRKGEIEEERNKQTKVARFVKQMRWR